MGVRYEYVCDFDQISGRQTAQVSEVKQQCPSLMQKRDEQTGVCEGLIDESGLE
jgi:hypothetical protein